MGMQNLRIFVDFATPPEILDLLRSRTKGHDLVFPARPVASVLARAEPDPQFESVDIAFGQPDPASVAGARRLKWIHVSSSGITRYDNAEFRALVARRTIAVSNSAAVYSEACALHALAFMLAQSRGLPAALGSRAPNGSEAWHALRHACVPLTGQSVLIAGYGAIGKRLVRMLAPFGMDIVAFRRKARGDEGVAVVSTAELETALRRADHVIDILPDSGETRGFFGRRRFEAMKRGGVFYNIGRGTTVDQDALLAALNERRLAAAWLDVTDPEPLPDQHPLRAEPNCHITPHVAGGHANETTTLVRHFLANFDRFVRGQPLLDRVM